MEQRDGDLLHLIQNYEMKMNKGQYAISEENRYSEELTQKQNEFKLQKRKMMTAAALHDTSIQRGETLLCDMAEEIGTLMEEMQRDRIQMDDVDLELQYLEEEMVNFKQRHRQQLEEERKQQ